MKKAITTQEAEWLDKFSYEHKLAQELQNELQLLITEKEELKVMYTQREKGGEREGARERDMQRMGVDVERKSGREWITE